MTKKIEYAVAAAGVFIQHLHREGFDRGMIATFGDSYRVDQGFTARESDLHYALSRIMKGSKDGSTRLYDSMANVCDTFWQSGLRDRPWLLVTVTDGQDNSSRTYRQNPAGAGQYVYDRYNRESSNFVFLLGVGSGNQIDIPALEALGRYGRFRPMAVDCFPLLEAFFLQIAARVSAGIAGVQLDFGNVSWVQLQRIMQVTQVPFDYCFLIDRSASMEDRG